jgi:hypothetical protein
VRTPSSAPCSRPSRSALLEKIFLKKENKLKMVLLGR